MSDRRGVMLPEVAVVRDPLELTRRLMNRVQRSGARFVQARVDRLVAQRGLVRAVRTDREEIRADVVVLALGAWSAPFARAFGARVPLVASAAIT